MEITVRIVAEPGNEEERSRPAPADERAAEVAVVEIPAAGDPFTAARRSPLGDS